ncbi:hypothetical protein AB835_12245 [Candidatus Endobugula sertula]|uniref:Carboxyltransferase domain-containing protein n=1 Tax=Candidatus Endobugula sertula TaxID=62101 RepID=A0A1D2QMK1_9GAMM|nr:hypothetical protein AB835_12245 [Candidatus Endobugula sertula]
MSLRVIKSGFLTLIQDYGRYGYQHIGITHSGPLDEHAFLWANHLLDNPYNTSQLEINYGGFSAEFTKSTMIAICGADLGATLNQQPITPWQSYAVYPGDMIYFPSPVSGLRSYLAIKQGFTISPQLSSCATIPREKLGGLSQNGEKLKKGDILTYPANKITMSRRVPSRFIPQYTNELTLRFVPLVSTTSAGYDAQYHFTKEPYEVTQYIDRMGYRLSGKTINTPFNGIISQGTSLGAIQVPKDGQPIVLLKDRQTMGGYPLLGCVVTRDISQLAQSRPGTKISFETCHIDDAEADLISYKRFFNLPF